MCGSNDYINKVPVTSYYMNSFSQEADCRRSKDLFNLKTAAVLDICSNAVPFRVFTIQLC